MPLSPSELQQLIASSQQDCVWDDEAGTYRIRYYDDPANKGCGEGWWRLVPRVTSITDSLDKSYFLKPWASKMQSEADMNAVIGAIRRRQDPIKAMEAVRHAYRNVQRAALDIGTEVHALAQHWGRTRLGMDSEEPEVSDQARWIFAGGFQKWAEGYGLEPLATEFRVFSRKHGYAGTMDLLAVILSPQPVFIRGDYKTSKVLGDAETLQMIAYGEALDEMCGERLTAQNLLIRFPKDGKKFPKPKAADDDAEKSGFRAFLGLKDALVWKSNGKYTAA